jgi:hypothetical protein
MRWCEVSKKDPHITQMNVHTIECVNTWSVCRSMMSPKSMPGEEARSARWQADSSSSGEEARAAQLLCGEEERKTTTAGKELIVPPLSFSHQQ